MSAIQFQGVMAARLGTEYLDEIHCQNQKLFPLPVPTGTPLPAAPIGTPTINITVTLGDVIEFGPPADATQWKDRGWAIEREMFFGLWELITRSANNPVGEVHYRNEARPAGAVFNTITGTGAGFKFDTRGEKTGVYNVITGDFVNGRLDVTSKANVLYRITVTDSLVPPPVTFKLPDNPTDFQRRRMKVKEGTFVTLLYPDHPATYRNEPNAGVYGWRHVGFFGVEAGKFTSVLWEHKVITTPDYGGNANMNLQATGVASVSRTGFYYVDLDADKRYPAITFNLTKKVGDGLYITSINGNWGYDMNLDTDFHYYFDLTP